MPLSQEFVQFLAEGDITVDDYNSLSTAEKISAVAKFRSSAPAPAPDIVQAEIAELRREFRSSQAQPAIHQVVTLSDASIDALATALENKRRERTSVFPTPLHPIAEEVQPAEPKVQMLQLDYGSGAAKSMDVGGGEDSAMPMWALFGVVIPCHIFICWSGNEFEKIFGWKFGWVLEEDGRKLMEFLYWTTNGVLGGLLLWTFSGFLKFLQRKRGLNILFAIVFTVLVISQLYISFVTIQ
eukprot:CAMPEP_0170125384 /NCGR_PEP_ID=MMETSP0020_2-20130122/18953_1 /TAXON_ID=98059 /ORGANISM="Dinobryon sp., Strain UTEXLB2267" /LENGTH=239 /DNA_ID=CAMNT_0010357923 /DNA_START=53 /DNA_END=771 /DNA_ORIENTATION=-